MKLEDGMEVERFCKKCEFSTKLIVRFDEKNGQYFLKCPECDFTETSLNCIFASLTKDRDLPPLKLDLGWENSWKEKPEIVERCEKTGHKRMEINKDPSWHGLHHIVICETCRYVYHYDSSD